VIVSFSDLTNSIETLEKSLLNTENLEISLYDESYNKTLKTDNVVYHLHERVFVQISTQLTNLKIKIKQCKLVTANTDSQNEFLLLNESMTKLNKMFGPFAYFEDGGNENEARFSFDSGLLDSDILKKIRCLVSVHTDLCKNSYQNCSLSSAQNISLMMPPITCKNETLCQNGCYVKSMKEFCKKPTTKLNSFDILSSMISKIEKSRHTKSCEEDQFQCFEGTCLPQEVRCNNIKECPDDSDEVECIRSSFSKDQCGKIKVAPKFTITSRIVGGEEATTGSWPWQVYMIINSKTSCGGSIISSRWILTAAHCLTERGTESEVDVYVGLHDKTRASEHTRLMNVNKIVIHEKYERAGAPIYDIALIRVNEIRFNDHIQPICLSNLNTEFAPGTSCVATGWGRLGPKTI